MDKDIDKDVDITKKKAKIQRPLGDYKKFGDWRRYPRSWIQLSGSNLKENASEKDMRIKTL
jgi:hypothetical protein